MTKKLLALSLLLSLITVLYSQEANHLVPVRTVTAGVTLSSLTDKILSLNGVVNCHSYKTK